MISPPRPGPSPITTFVAGMAATESLGDISVLCGANAIAAAGRPPRVVIFPTVGSSEGQANITGSVRDIRQSMAARCWGRDDDDAWDLAVRVLRALDEQAAAGGLYWYGGDLTWDASPDTSQQGQSVTVSFDVRLSADRIPPSTGEIQSISYSRE